MSTRRAECPHCEQTFTYAPDQAGEDVACPHCAEEVTLPAAKPAPAPAPQLPVAEVVTAAPVSELPPSPRDVLVQRIVELRAWSQWSFVAGLVMAIVLPILCAALVFSNHDSEAARARMRGWPEPPRPASGAGTALLLGIAVVGFSKIWSVEAEVLENRLLAGDMLASRR